jgi:1-acyl-sn-glycerol-3-phosphate acyltransferase
MALRASSPSHGQAGNGIRRLAIIAAYVAVFWGALPAALVGLGLAFDRALNLDASPNPLGFVAVVPGVALLIWGMVELRWRGRGLPISALPPPRLVVSGPYRFVRHPIYLGWSLAVFGLGLVVGSQGLAFVVAPALIPAWILYAHHEERGLARRFGDTYRRYQRRVGLFPWVDLYHVTRLLVRARALPVSVEGADRIPRTGPAVLVANHACYLDPAFVGRATHRTIWFTTTAEVFRKGVAAFLLRRLPAVPLRRYRPDPVACREMVRLLKEGEIVGIFPEGERTPHGGRQAPLESVASLLARLPYPILPVGIVGSADVGPRWSDSLRRRPVTVRIGPPLSLTPGDAVRQIEEAWRWLIPDTGEAVHLDGLDRGKLARILWRCPACGDEEEFRPALLSCDACGARWTPKADGFLEDRVGAVMSLAALARSGFGFAEKPELRVPAAGSSEPSILGPIGPMEPLGEGELRVDPKRLTFRDLEVRLADIRSATTERADTLQVATRTRMWQFRLQGGSAFRLKNALDRWCHANRAVADGEPPGTGQLPAST